MFKNYNIDGNKEMIAIGTMNIVGSFTSCYLTTGNINTYFLLVYDSVDDETSSTGFRKSCC